MAVAFVQAGNNTQHTGGTDLTCAVTLGATVGSGNAVMGYVTWDKGGGATLSSITDDQSNSYSVVTGGDRLDGFYRVNITNAPITITLGWTGTLQYIAVVVFEASGVATTSAFDQNANAAGTLTTTLDSLSSGSVTTTANGEFIVGGAVQLDGTDFNCFDAGTDYTLPANGYTGSAAVMNLAAEYRAQTSAGGIAATWTKNASGSNSCQAMIMTFKAGSSVVNTTITPYTMIAGT